MKGTMAGGKPGESGESGESGENDEQMEKQNPEMEAAGEDEEEEENGEEETEKGCAMKKSGLRTDDLEKSLGKLEAMVKSDDPPSRRDALMDKARSDELSKSERNELFDLLGGESSSVSQDPVGDAIVKSMGENETLVKALDVSDYLQEQHGELVKSLRAVGDEIRKSDTRNHDFNVVMARAVNDIGLLVKSLAETVEHLAQQPVRGPKSMGVRTRGDQVLQKSFASQPSSDEQMSRGDILAGFEGIMQKSMQSTNPGVTSAGEDITLAVAKYEQTHQISRPMLDAIQTWSREQAAAAH